MVFSPLSSTKLEACTCAEAQVHASVLLSPSPLLALRERGIKGVRVPLGGCGYSPKTRAQKPLDSYYNRAKLFHSSN